MRRIASAAVVATAGLGPASAAAHAAPPAAPALVGPASGATVNADVHQVFTIRAVDSDGDPYTGRVTVRDASTNAIVASFSTAPAPSGRNSSGFRSQPLPSGDYTWSARATDVLGNDGPESPSRPLTVRGGADAGSGSVSGTASFSQPIPRAANPGNPLTFQACAQTSFSVDGFSAGAVASPIPFVGPFTFTGSGGSACETATLGSGTLELSAQGTGFLGTSFDCPTLWGGYTRTATDVHAVLGGICTVNGVPDSATFDLRLALVPTSGGGTQAIAAADFQGAFVVAPTS